jgi:hypothetical protein
MREVFMKLLLLFVTMEVGGGSDLGIPQPETKPKIILQQTFIDGTVATGSFKHFPHLKSDLNDNLSTDTSHSILTIQAFNFFCLPSFLKIK